MENGTFVDVRGVKLHLRRGGKGAPLLFLHGAQGFDGSDAALGELMKSFDVLAPDHPGFGRSADADAIDDVPDLAFFYLDMIAALGLDRVHLVGQSIGGWAALEMAIRSTQRIRSLSLAGAAGIRIRGVPRADMFICTPEELARLLFAGDGWKAWSASLQGTPELQEIADRNRFTAAKLCWQPRLYDPKLEKWLHRIDRPTCLIWGAEDKIIPPAYGTRLAELIAGARLTLVPGAGHLVHVEAPARFAAEIERFIGNRGMKILFFHLMPYADLDLNYQEKYRTDWVVLPNSYFDPKKGHELYNRYLDELELAAELGFDGISVNEHHQNAYGLMPSPIVMASALARRTKDCKIAILGNAFCLREHPLTLAEEHAMIDVLTGGRLISGMVRGIGAEYFSLGVNPAFSHARFQEAHDLVVQAWTRPGPFAFEGRHYNFEYVNPWPRPYQQPHPPIWCPSLGSTETIEWASHPARRYVYIQNFSPVAAVVRYLNLYRRIAERTHGYVAASEQIGWAAPIYLADTDEQAVDEARPHIEALFNKFLTLPFEMLFPPGYVSAQSLKSMRAVKRPAIAGGKVTIESLIETGIFLCGSPDTVRRKLIDSHRVLGFQNFLAVLQLATLPRDLTEKNLRLFAREILPALQALTDKDYAGMDVEAVE